MIITVIIQVIFVYYSTLDNSSKNKNNIVFYLPLIVCILLLVGVLYNAVALIYTLVKKIKEWRLSQSLESDEKEVQKMRINLAKDMIKGGSTPIPTDNPSSHPSTIRSPLLDTTSDNSGPQ